MSHRKIIEKNTAAARNYRKPLDREQRKPLDDGIKKLSRARELFSQLAPNVRQWYGIDLQAATQACPGHLDWGAILEWASRLLG